MKISDFIGLGSAVSLSSQNLVLLSKLPYVACEKTDGVRYLLYAGTGLVFLIDREEQVRVVNMCLPLPGLPSQTDVHSAGLPPLLVRHQSTLLDGELVEDILADGTRQVSFLIYDCISVQRNGEVMHMNLLERLKQALVRVVQPRLEYELKYPEAVAYEKQTNNYLPLYLKDFYEIYDIMAVRNASKRLPHYSDGLIFTPTDLPYIPGTCRQLLKWKPPELNTVDFAANLIFASDTEGHQVPVGAKLYTSNGGFRVDSGFYICAGYGYWNEMVKLQNETHACDGGIWECYYDPEALSLVPEPTEQREIPKSIDLWEKFWCNHRPPAEEPAKQRHIRRVVDQLLQNQSGDLEFGISRDSSKPTPEIGVLPISKERMSRPSLFPSDVCPYAKCGVGKYNYDYTRARVVKGGWVMERVRTDKRRPNDHRVMEKVKESIHDGIDLARLYHTILTYREASRVRPVHTSCVMPPMYKEHGSLSQFPAEKGSRPTSAEGSRKSAPAIAQPTLVITETAAIHSAAVAVPKADLPADDDASSNSSLSRRLSSSSSSGED